jgi:hypothetical protein
MSPEARESSFDELARGLASGSVTRGRALRLMGAASLGARWHRWASVRLPPTLRAVRPTGSTASGTSSAVAETAPTAAPALPVWGGVHSLSSPAPRTLTAVPERAAAQAKTASVDSR